MVTVTAHETIPTTMDTSQHISVVQNPSSIENTIKLPHTKDIGDKSEPTDQEELVFKASQGDSMAFGDIVNQYSTLMLRTAAMIVGDRDIAEDIVQDSFIQAWHHLPDLRQAGALRPWLMRIVVNQCISFKRRLSRTTAFMRQAVSEQETDLLAQVADDHKGRMESNWDLAHAIEGLPIKQRVVIVQHYYNGMTLPEMARSLQTSENTLKKRIQAALANLRRILHTSSEEDDISLQGARNMASSIA
jgi:RNA polymerase sigma-70 factor, ECF subfamily